MAAILEKEPPPLNEVQPLAPVWLDHIIRRCLRKNPDERWQSAKLESQLKGKRCRTYSSDLRTLVTASGAYFYPDVSIVCGPLILKEGSNDNCTNPALIVEVLSPSTAAYDRGLKFQLTGKFQALTTTYWCTATTSSSSITRVSRMKAGCSTNIAAPERVCHCQTSSANLISALHTTA